MSREVVWLLVGWQVIATVAFLSWVLSDITKPKLRTRPRTWLEFAADYAFYLLVSVMWPVTSLLMLVMFVWAVLISPARRSP